jgi:hypothetical protein
MNAVDKGIISLDEVTAAEKENIEKNAVQAEIYVKYKPWYWRHWKLKDDRYDYKPKICV